MRKWLVEETGEFRRPKGGEIYYSLKHNDFFRPDIDYVGDEYPIVTIREITDVAENREEVEASGKQVGD